MGFFRSHFALNKSQRNGIFILLLLIIILQAVIIWMNYLPSHSEGVENDEELTLFRNRLDSISKVKQHTRDTIYPFNPNYLTDHKAYQLGMNMEEIDRLLNYRKQGNWINSSEDFKQVTQVDDSLLKKLSPSFRFPEWVTKRNIDNVDNNLRSAPVTVVFRDINSASAEDLKQINGIGEVLAERIVKYRYRLGGFQDMIQLNDVYGLSPEVISRVKMQFKVITKPAITKVSINTASESEISAMPYFNPELARKIVNYRNLHERIRSFEELKSIPDFPADKIERIQLYLSLD